ncbi:MAG: nucleotidyltransferase domain-containing protein [Flammeovirgaceae bacterium]|nr:nucleotidyltransferase domain-containing protein [Flammeovirgaceae bacterium]
MVKKPDLIEIKETILTFLHERGITDATIKVFGSIRSSSFSPDSDIDLIIVTDSFEGLDIFQRAKNTYGLDLMLIRKFNMPFDILLKTKNEYTELTAMKMLEAIDV